MVQTSSTTEYFNITQNADNYIMRKTGSLIAVLEMDKHKAYAEADIKLDHILIVHQSKFNMSRGLLSC